MSVTLDQLENCVMIEVEYKNRQVGSYVWNIFNVSHVVNPFRRGSTPICSQRFS